jgi:hypothetical protein
MPGLLVLGIVFVGALFAVNVVRPSRRLLLLGLVAKLAGPLVFAAAATMGYAPASSWYLVFVTDLLWVPPLVILLRRRSTW